MKADDSRDRTAHTLRILGLIILVIGLLTVVWQIPNIMYDINGEYLNDLIEPLSWIVIGIAIEFFGIGLIIFGNRK